MGVPSCLVSVNRMRFSPQTTCPGPLIRSGRMSDADAWLQPARLSGGVGAVAQAAVPDETGPVGAPVPAGPGPHPPTAMASMAEAVAAARNEREERGNIPAAYPCSPEGGVER